MYRIGVDVGGTFTDFVMVNTQGGPTAFHKVPSTPDDPSRAIASGIVEMLELNAVVPEDVSYVGHGTTVATNMVIERRGVPTGLLTTRGFRDVLAIGRQTRPSLFDWAVRKPTELVERHRRVEVDERLDKSGTTIAAPDLAAVEKLVVQLRDSGVKAVAVGFLHSYRNPEHERAVRDLITRVAPELYVSVSSEVVAEFREYERFSTTVLNAYVGPHTQKYLHRLREKIAASGIRVEPLTFHSNGGLLPVQTVEELPVLTCLSGPAAGVIGSARIGAEIGESEIITFDVGGTSTDVSLITGGRAQFTSSRLVAGHPVRMPMVDIHVIGAGGGSIARLDDAGALKVGPTSAGAMPGPISYLRGGTEVTLTDANIVLGRLNPVALLEGRMKVDRGLAYAAIRSQIADPLGISVEDAAHGVVSIATANMSRAIRSVSIEHGHDLAGFTLFAFGGAGPMMACFLARELNMRETVVPPTPGVLSALGGLIADIKNDFIKTLYSDLLPTAGATIRDEFAGLENRARIWLHDDQGYAGESRLLYSAEMRYRGQSFELDTPLDPAAVAAGDTVAMAQAFHAEHERVYGHSDPTAAVQIISLRLVISGRTARPEFKRHALVSEAAAPRRHAEVWLDGALRSVAVFARVDLKPGQSFAGPAVVTQDDCTTVVPPNMTVSVDAYANLRIVPETQP